MIIYALIDPRDGNVRYVGKTHRTAHRRLRRHLAPSMLTGDTHKERWIRVLLALGLEPIIRVLRTCLDAQSLIAAERAIIAEYRAGGADLTNATPGGDGGSGAHSTASREKIRRALTGKPKSDAHRRHSGEAQRGRRATEETRVKLRAAHQRPRGPMPEPQRLSLALAKGGRPFIDQHGRVFYTQKGAARTLGLNVGHLNEVLHGTRRSVGGFSFRFIESDLRVREFPPSVLP